ncbi:MAG TPA: hypothetical protein VF275_00110 [Gammaproteobacteria bacterium]
MLGECDGEIDYDKRRDALNDFNYVIRRRCIRADLNDSTSDAVYLGGNGRWHANIARARKFASLPAIDAVLQETWSRLRNAGERSVILSVVKTPLRDNEQAPGTREIERNRGADCPRRDG